jgi:hypothetical protein
MNTAERVTMIIDRQIQEDIAMNFIRWIFSWYHTRREVNCATG